METLYVSCVLQDFVVWTVQNIVDEILFWVVLDR